MFFGLSLYGVPSINLDKMKGYEIKRKLQLLFLLYVLTIVGAWFLPTRISIIELGSATLLEENKSEHKLQKVEDQSDFWDNKFYRLRESFQITEPGLTNFEI